MTVLYLLPINPPVIEGTEAVIKEIELLRQATDGTILDISPKGQIARVIRTRFCGMNKLHKIWTYEKTHAINHVHFPALYPFPFMRLVKNPIVYTVTASLNKDKKPRDTGFFKRLKAIVVSNERDLGTLNSWGLTNGQIVHPGIPLDHIVRCTKNRSQKKFHLLMASAPWSEQQFDEKGVDAILEAVKQDRNLHLTLLWRGLLEQGLQSRIIALGIADQVNVVNRAVDINEHFSKTSATILASKRGDIIKAFPNSLVESLMAGNPVILSNAIPMADFVKSNNCGVILDEVNSGCILDAISAIRDDQNAFSRRVAKLDMEYFDARKMVNSYQTIYRA